MSSTKIIEIAVGVFVVAGVAALMMLSINVSNINTLGSNSYSITAKFDNVSGLKERSAVSIAGVTIGRVSSIVVDPETFEAVVEMKIDKVFNEIPMDSSAAIFTAGLLGEKYVGIDPGGAPDFLEQGSEIHLTQSSVVLEKLIGQFLVSKADE